MPILPADRDPCLITIRGGGTLTDAHHRLLAERAVVCADHVLHLFEAASPGDTRPRDALEIARAWIRGEVPMRAAHKAAFRANAAGRGQHLRRYRYRMRKPELRDTTPVADVWSHWVAIASTEPLSMALRSCR